MQVDDALRRSHAVQERVRELPGWEAMRTVLVYLPFQNEVDTWDLIHELWGRGVQTLAPCCRPDCPGEMDLYRFRALEDLRPGSYTIPEPDPSRCTMVDPRECEGILIPGVGFDRRGFRLGFGGGYYDRLLALTGAEVRTIGLAYKFQILDDLPLEPHDQSVQVICTDTETIWAPT
ncbi:5-formyltetrahydrofolate cyclo-ligase [Desulfonatronum thiosulfatophilum]|uniref:5-formyltetrahydrofolate cyclo-ligase n=2 Tax=Desulfonatronum thiosulfatophilum TaxID=617002 RepID=A0A1G6AWI2_9BACT|nr:5-formyltetrahydrofolate cyclo-ligase [Desulfonatronum thiosulfatophilum]